MSPARASDPYTATRHELPLPDLGRQYPRHQFQLRTAISPLRSCPSITALTSSSCATRIPLSDDPRRRRQPDGSAPAPTRSPSPVPVAHRPHLPAYFFDTSLHPRLTSSSYACRHLPDHRDQHVVAFTSSSCARSPPTPHRRHRSAGPLQSPVPVAHYAPFSTEWRIFTPNRAPSPVPVTHDSPSPGSPFCRVTANGPVADRPPTASRRGTEPCLAATSTG